MLLFCTQYCTDPVVGGLVHWVNHVKSSLKDTKSFITQFPAVTM